jgi:hypothetical protein
MVRAGSRYRWRIAPGRSSRRVGSGTRVCPGSTLTSARIELVSQEQDPLDRVGLVPCPSCLTSMRDVGDDEDGRDARLECPSCGLVLIAD